ncbi:MAG: hypothetical protein HY895_23620 [Deltaproteobacteria bacterium]|nr:hypothetical protein [Deltaproteobacteria bacterium]
MIHKVDVPLNVDPQALVSDLRVKAKTLHLDINIQRRHIFEPFTAYDSTDLIYLYFCSIFGYLPTHFISATSRPRMNAALVFLL